MSPLGASHCGGLPTSLSGSDLASQLHFNVELNYILTGVAEPAEPVIIAVADAAGATEAHDATDDFVVIEKEEEKKIEEGPKQTPQENW